MSSRERKRAAILKRRTTRPEKRTEVRLSSRRFRTRILSVRSIKLRKRFLPGTVITDMRYPIMQKTDMSAGTIWVTGREKSISDLDLEHPH